MKAFIFDVETSGLIDNRTMPADKLPEIIDLYSAVVDLQTGEVGDEIEQLFKPVRPISDEITKITGLTNEDLADAPPFSSMAPTFRAALASADCVIAHNLSFDAEMVDIEFERLGLPPVQWPRKICTVESTVHLKGFRLNLQGLHELLFGERFQEAHRAKPDAQALIRCAVELFKRGEI